ncbi:sarcoplasmic calcium-binding protein-like [Ruditapes philippinarum]|uniref:sarcoplasmic calcium-binding protein-like n=1 Tax=Ruditapes philippinarum TaxID=129788 RepID=UPI00295ABEDF|nr:sarcoplasmic calcium-binding protein-like [Ruditapes philippinarum]
MPSDYLVSKWKMWFKCLDVKHDGKIAKADMDAADSTFVHLHHIEAEPRKVILKQLAEWWDEYIFHHKPGPLSEQDFVDNLNRELQAGKEAFKQRMTVCMKTIFDILNISHEGSMTQNEFVIAFRSSAHENLKLDSDFFYSYNPVDGKVPVQKICDSWVQFTTCEDSSLKDVVKEAFEAGV